MGVVQSENPSVINVRYHPELQPLSLKIVRAFVEERIDREYRLHRVSLRLLEEAKEHLRAAEQETRESEEWKGWLNDSDGQAGPSSAGSRASSRDQRSKPFADPRPLSSHALPMSTLQLFYRVCDALPKFIPVRLANFRPSMSSMMLYLTFVLR